MQRREPRCRQTLSRARKLPVLTADDDERFPQEFYGEIVTGIGRLTAMADAMPVSLEQALHLALEERGVAIKPPAEGVAGAVGRNRRGEGIDGTARPRFALAQWDIHAAQSSFARTDVLLSDFACLFTLATIARKRRAAKVSKSRSNWR